MTNDEKFNTDPSWMGIIKWGGISLFVSGAIALLFFVLVITTKQTLPVPAKEILENPLRPCALFLIVIVGEILLLPSGIALYFSLKNIRKTPMILATAFWVLCVPMFLISRGFIFAISQLSDKYLETSSEILKVSYLASAELALESQNLYAMMGLILLSTASIIMGSVMLKGKEIFGKSIGYIVIGAGTFTFLGAISVTVEEIPIVFPVIGVIITAIWQFYIGLKLYKMGKKV